MGELVVSMDLDEDSYDTVGAEFEASLGDYNEAHVKDVLAECKHVIVRMAFNLMLSCFIFTAVLVLQAFCILQSDRIYTLYRVNGSVKPTYLGEQVSFNMTGLYDFIQVMFYNCCGKGSISIHHIDTLVGVLTAVVVTKNLIFSPFMSAVNMLTRATILMSEIYFIRGLSILVTVVPSETCDPVDLKEEFGSQFLHILKGYVSKKVTCTDNIISGHAAIATLMAHIFVTHNRAWHVNTLVATLSATICFLLIVAKVHYTIDVVLGILLASFLYLTHLWIVEQVGRCAVDSEYKRRYSPHILCQMYSKLELVDERVRLFFRLRELKGMEVPNLSRNSKLYIQRYFTLFGIDESDDPRMIYGGCDLWTTSGVTRFVGLFKLRRRRRVEELPPPSANVDTPNE